MIACTHACVDQFEYLRKNNQLFPAHDDMQNKMSFSYVPYDLHPFSYLHFMTSYPNIMNISNHEMKIYPNENVCNIECTSFQEKYSLGKSVHKYN